MKIMLNGEECEIDDGLALEAMLETSGYSEKRVAVEINRQIIPRSRYNEQTLKPGDRVEIVHAIGGG